MIRFENAIERLFPDTEWVCYGANLDGLEFMDKSIKKPTQAQIDAALKELEAEAISESKTNASAKSALLEKLGITEDEAKLLLG